MGLKAVLQVQRLLYARIFFTVAHYYQKILISLLFLGIFEVTIPFILS